MAQPKSDGQAIVEIEAMLQGELEGVKKTNQRSMVIGGVMFLIIGGYLLWANAQVKKLFDPEGLALAASGMALGAVPDAADALRLAVVDGAPDIARTASQSIVDMLPTYRMVMEDELDPVVDEVTAILAQATVTYMVRAGGGDTEATEQMALQAGADAVMTRFDYLIDSAMDEPLEHDGPTPRQSIEASLGQLVTIDRGLKRVAKGRGDPQQRELLLTWINLIGQYQDTANLAAAHKTSIEGPVED